MVEADTRWNLIGLPEIRTNNRWSDWPVPLLGMPRAFSAERSLLFLWVKRRNWF